MQGLLEVIRVQRHDFMNHLQVISGLLQLEHYDRAREYIKQAAEELQQKSVFPRLGSPEVTAAILRAEIAAAKNNIQINTHIGIDQRENISLDCAEAEVLKLLLDAPTVLIEDVRRARAVIDLSILEEGAEYLFQVSFKCRAGAEQALAEKISSMEKAAAAANGGLRVLRGAAGKTILTLVIPITESEAAAALE